MNAPPKLAHRDRASWRVGQRVTRSVGAGGDLGTVVEMNGNIKVKWDRGATSYFRPGDRANVHLELSLPQVTNNPQVAHLGGRMTPSRWIAEGRRVAPSM